MEGVNVSLFLYGSTGSGKTHTMQGQGADTGLVTLLADNLFNILDEKRYENPSFQFNVKIRFYEILDEEAQDLLQQGGGQGFGKQHIKIDEWEGPFIQGVSWVPIPNSSQLNDFFQGGCRNMTKRQNEFGRMRDKSAQLFQIEITQNMQHATSGDS